MSVSVVKYYPLYYLPQQEFQVVRAIHKLVYSAAGKPHIQASTQGVPGLSYY